MELGSFSVSLEVKDMAKSREFYEKIGFEMVGGDGENWTIIANESTVLGLFKGMIDATTLTFNPGWVGLAEPHDEFSDIRSLSSELTAAGIKTLNDTTPDTPSGPASLMVHDPDGHAILLDQHV